VKERKVKAKESEIQAQIKQYLQYSGWLVVKIHQSLGSYRGIADLYCLKDGEHIWIEVKTPEGKQSEAQKQFERDITSRGGKYMIARCLDDVLHLGKQQKLSV